MAKMSEETAARLDKLYTETTPSVNLNRPGVFARKSAMAVFLDEFTSRYLASKMQATHRTPAELISDMVNNEIQAAQ